MTRTYSEAQMAYMVAQAIYQAGLDAYNAELLPLEALADTNEEAWLDALAALDEKYQTDAAYTVVAEAERALVAWGRTQIASLPQYRSQRALLDDLFVKAERNVTIRAKVADLAMQLVAA